MGIYKKKQNKRNIKKKTKKKTKKQHFFKKPLQNSGRNLCFPRTNFVYFSCNIIFGLSCVVTYKIQWLSLKLKGTAMWCCVGINKHQHFTFTGDQKVAASIPVWSSQTKFVLKHSSSKKIYEVYLLNHQAASHI